MDITKQVFNREEFREALGGIGDTKFQKLKLRGIIPDPDNLGYSPHEWNRATVLRAIDEYNEYNNNRTTASK